MKLLDLLNYVIVAVVLLAIGYVAKVTGIWSFYNSVTIPYICFAGATALMIVAATCLVCQKPLLELPWTTIIIVSGAFFVISGTGVFVYYFQDWFKTWGNHSFLVSILEWVGASAVLVLTFVLPRLK